ncbi:MAG: signal peptide peptidase SppA [Bacteroidales bacterium]|nr:signal peptide peptidase SppA [Bacteroidales bacterium]
MNNFWKVFFASILGVFFAFGLVIFLVFGSFSLAFSSFKTEAPTIVENSILHIDFKSEIPDRTSSNPLSNFDFSSMQSNKSIGLNDVLKSIDKAKTDDNIKGIFIDISVMSSGMATTEEIRNALIDFKESEKFIIAYSDVLSQTAYYLASVADKIYLNPQGAIDWKGLYSQVMFFKGALEKLGVEVQVFRHGKFKSAIEPYILDKMSEENKLQTLTYVKSLWDHLVEGIAETRDISVEELNLYADNLSVENALAAYDFKFVDSLVYRDFVLEELKEMANYGKDDDKFLISINKYSKAPVKSAVKEISKNRVAVIFAEGTIVDGKGSDGEIGGDNLAAEIRKARKDENIKAVVLRVNSPGGSGLASEIILHEMVLLKEEKPVVISMGSLAASGGYYIACKSDYIFALPNTLTGSIGVFGMLPNLQKLFENKLGLSFDGIGTNAHSDFGNTSRSVDELEYRRVQAQVENFYDVFITHVAEGRNMSKEEVDEIGQGRVWSGLNALEIGLVDEIGGLNDAIKKAVELAGLEDYRIKEMPEKKDFFETMLEDLTSQVSIKSLEAEFGENLKYLDILRYINNAKGVQARLPYEIYVY